MVKRYDDHWLELVAMMLLFLAVLAVLFWAGGCTATQAGEGAEVTTAGVLAEISASLAAIEMRVGDVHVQGVDELTAALATLRAEIDAAVIKLEHTINSSAGRDVNAADYWGTRLAWVLLVGYLALDRVLDRRQRHRRRLWGASVRE